MTPRRRLALVLTAVLTALLIGGAAAWALAPARQTADIAMPADDASPEQVVTTYLEALAAHDCETAERLHLHGPTDCEALTSLRIRSVRLVLMEPPTASRRYADREAALVRTRVDQTWRAFEWDAPPRVDGVEDLGYYLVRVGPDADGPWRIFDAGNG